MAGIDFPVTGADARSTTATGRAVVAEALREVDPVGALAVEHETAWRSRYVAHFRRLVEAGLASPQAWTTISRSGLDAVWDRMCVVSADGPDTSLTSLLEAPPQRTVQTWDVFGEREPEAGFSLPYHGRRLTGAALEERLSEWTTRGVLEPSAAEAVREVVAHPEWLS